MLSIYTLVADPEWAEIFTLLTLAMLSLGWLSFMWANAKKLNKKFSTFELGLVYFLGFIFFLCGVTIFGKFVVPQNADSLIEMIGMDRALRYCTAKLQFVLLALLRPLI